MTKLTTLQPDTTVFSEDAELKGTLSFATKLEFNGRFEGEIYAEGPLIIGEKAIIKGDIHASSTVSIFGKIKGNITTKDRLELKEMAQVYGDVKSLKLAIAEGAVFVGHSETLESSGAPAEFANIFTRLSPKDGAAKH